MGIANPFGRRLRCYTLHLLLQSLWLVVLVLLHLLLLPPLPLINGIGIARRANQPLFVCYASMSMKTTSSTELVLW